MNRIIFTQKLNERRKQLGFNSVQKLANKYNELFTDEYNEKGNPTSGILGTLKKYCNENDNTVPRIDIVMNLCNKELLDCSLDYLVGKDLCTNKVIQFIHEKTGLSEKAISQIIDVNENDLLTMLVLNLLLEIPQYTKVLPGVIYNYLKARSDKNNLLINPFIKNDYLEHELKNKLWDVQNHLIYLLKNIDEQQIEDFIAEMNKIRFVERKTYSELKELGFYIPNLPFE